MTAFARASFGGFYASVPPGELPASTNGFAMLAYGGVDARAMLHVTVGVFQAGSPLWRRRDSLRRRTPGSPPGLSFVSDGDMLEMTVIVITGNGGTCDFPAPGAFKQAEPALPKVPAASSDNG